MHSFIGRFFFLNSKKQMSMLCRKYFLVLVPKANAEEYISVIHRLGVVEYFYLNQLATNY